LQVDLTTAERIKVEYEKIATKLNKQSAVINDSKGNEVKFRPTLVRDIIEARTEEIFEAVNKKLMTVGKVGDLPGGVVLAGGGANMYGIVDVCKSTMKLPVETVTLNTYGGITDNVGGLEMATVSGLMELDKLGAGVGKKNFKLNLSGGNSVLRTIFERFKP